jgi:hypothetical protein
MIFGRYIEGSPATSSGSMAAAAPAAQAVATAQPARAQNLK